MNAHHPMILDGSGIPDLPVVPGLPPLAACSPPDEHADSRVLITDETSQITAHAALWWKQTPTMDGRHVGAIGGFAASDGQSASQLLAHAREVLRIHGCQVAIGPMNGNTWRRYRYVIESDGSPPFLLEPVNPEEYPTWWRDTGFTELARYSSSLLELPAPPSASPQARDRLLRGGISIRPLNPERYEQELKSIHEISLRSFAANFLYTPLEEEAFIAAYLRVRDHVDPRFVRIAERDGIPCGFVFGIPDLNAVQAGRKPALIVKTLAVDPQSRCAGLGSVLVDVIQQAAADAGYTHAIHALQHERNVSLKITQRNSGVKFRQYALFHQLL